MNQSVTRRVKTVTRRTKQLRKEVFYEPGSVTADNKTRAEGKDALCVICSNETDRLLVVNGDEYGPHGVYAYTIKGLLEKLSQVEHLKNGFTKSLDQETMAVATQAIETWQERCAPSAITPLHQSQNRRPPVGGLQTPLTPHNHPCYTIDNLP